MNEQSEVQELREVMTALRETALPIMRDIVSLLPNLLQVTAQLQKALPAAQER
jgi:hypothetical protein